MSELNKKSFLNALGTLVYISAVAIIVNNVDKLFRFDDDATGLILAPIAFLTLFVISAAVTGGLVVGKPLLMYLAGQKTEAVKMFMYTIGWLAAGLVVIFAILFLIS